MSFHQHAGRSNTSKLLMLIRPATESDAERLSEITQLAYGPYVQALGRKPAPMMANFSAQIHERLVCVVCNDEDVVGYVTFYPDGQYMHLSSVALDPKWRSEGYGKALIDHVETQAQASELSGIELYTNAAMMENLQIYEHLGFKVTDRRQEYGFNRIYLRKTF